MVSKVNLKLEVGSQIREREILQTCVLRNWNLGLDVSWEQHYRGSTEGAKLGIREFQGNIRIPGESLAGVHPIPPKMLSETFYEPTLSREFELGWVKSTRRTKEPDFVSTDELAEECMTQFLNLLRKHST